MAFATGVLLGVVVIPRVGPFAASSTAAATSPDTPGTTPLLAGRVSATRTAPDAPGSAAPVPAAPSEPVPSPRRATPAVDTSSFVDWNIPFTAPVDCGGSSCQVQLDVHVPAGPGPFPTVVMIRGGPSGLGGRSYLNSFAAQLASAGILVFNADYRDRASEGGGYPAAFEDVACAIRFARVQAPKYRGEVGSVTLVGHSLGGWVGSVVALDPTEFEGGCLANGSGRPNAFVGLAGNYQIDSGGNATDLSIFFGGSADQTAKARAASNPFNYATGTPIPMRLVAGTADTTVDPAASVALDSFLDERGWDVSLDLVPGASHSSIIGTGSDSQASLREVSAAVIAAGYAG